jgi:hypothetical protein
MNTS